MIQRVVAKNRIREKILASYEAIGRTGRGDLSPIKKAAFFVQFEPVFTKLVHDGHAVGQFQRAGKSWCGRGNVDITVEREATRTCQSEVSSATHLEHGSLSVKGENKT